MRRDPDLIRKIAFATEELKPGQHLTGVDGVSNAAFAAHVQWMVDADLAEATVQQYISGEDADAFVIRLTWNGCDFLDAARSDTLWAKAKQSVLAPSASWTFDILKEWLKSEIKNGLPTFRSLGS